jgi:signal peptidase II
MSSKRVSDFLSRRPALRYGLAAAAAAAIAVIALDQLTKQAVVVGMNLQSVREISVVPGLNFRMAWNTGVNFGLFSGGGELTRVVFSVGTSIVALALLLGALACKRMISAIGLGIAAGGAIGNIIDRLTWGRVADFINVSCCGIDNPWSFNVADIAVFIGFAMLLIPLRPRPAEPNAAG